jgi:hypothetical protein
MPIYIAGGPVLPNLSVSPEKNTQIHDSPLLQESLVNFLAVSIKI